MLKIEQFVKEQFGITLTKHQLEIIAMIAANPDEKMVVYSGGKLAGKTTAFKAAFAYLQDGLKTVGKPRADGFKKVEIIVDDMWVSGALLDDDHLTALTDTLDDYSDQSMEGRSE